MLFKIFTVGEEVKELKGYFIFIDPFPAAALLKKVAEGEDARAAALDLHKVGGQEDGAHKAQVEQVLAVITGGHHTHRHAHARAAAGVGGQKARFAVKVVVGKLHSHVLRAGDKGRDLHGKIGIVFAGELFMRELG